MLFLVGLALSVAQFVMIRDFVSILYGEEVVIVLVTASFFFGLSVGYVCSLRLSQGVFRALFIASVFLHLTFPFSYRYLASWFSAIDLGGYAFLGLLFGYAVLFNSIFAAFLPRLISVPDDTATDSVARLRRCYGIELAGFVAGVAVVALSWNHPMGALLAAYWVVLALLVHLVLGKPLLTGVYVVLALLVLLNIGALDRHSTELLYREKHNIRGARVLFSVNSAYQKVEVVDGASGTRYLYLDGLQNLNSTDLDALNLYIAEVPAELIRPEHALIIGNGTLSSVPRVYPHARAVTSVELDGGVLEAGRRFFADTQALQGLDRWQLHVDDGKHFLGQSDERFDLIVMDVPSPITIQEAYLHTEEFYRLAGERLTERGVIAVQLSGPLQRNDRTPARVTAALRQVFPQVMVIFSERADRGFAYASRNLPFSGRDMLSQARAYDDEVAVIEAVDVDDYLSRAVPLSLESMDLVLRRGWERFRRRYF